MSNTLPSKHLKYLHLIKQLKLFDDDFMTLALRENNEFHDEGYIIYVNGENEDDTPLGRLMHDSKCTNPNNLYYNLLFSKNKSTTKGNVCSLTLWYFQNHHYVLLLHHHLRLNHTA